jgi:hypothetical protein
VLPANRSIGPEGAFSAGSYEIAKAMDQMNKLLLIRSWPILILNLEFRIKALLLQPERVADHGNRAESHAALAIIGLNSNPIKG